ncbi:hypothetical protein [Streptomyces formicae]|uniref:Uncharacterized protein n=1 Tax=Streptomyces formicae TaxID=1616117 RepID=A0A291QM33_9ACTN|nr:hypothetical protein [Streptomyces formicae]ATL32759.1 hypothetical protein KY5_7741c [Streptomyces formicae]
MGEVSFVSREVHVAGVRIAAVRDGREIRHIYVYRLDNDGRDDQHRRLESYGLRKWGHEFRLDLEDA